MSTALAAAVAARAPARRERRLGTRSGATAAPAAAGASPAGVPRYLAGGGNAEAAIQTVRELLTVPGPLGSGLDTAAPLEDVVSERRAEAAEVPRPDAAASSPEPPYPDGGAAAPTPEPLRERASRGRDQAQRAAAGAASSAAGPDDAIDAAGADAAPAHRPRGGGNEGAAGEAAHGARTNAGLEAADDAAAGAASARAGTADGAAAPDAAATGGSVAAAAAGGAAAPTAVGGAARQGGVAAGGGSAVTLDAGEALGALATGDIALIDTELAEHQRWGAASARVGAAGSAGRAQFIVQQAGAGALGALGHGALMGAGMGAFGAATELGAGRLVARLAGPALARSFPVPAIGAVIGGVFSVCDLATRDWGRSGETIGRFGEGGSIYEQLANSIAAVSEIIGIATAVLNVIAGVIGAISIAMWIISVLTVGVASPLAATLSTIAAAIGIATMILDAINALVLQRLVTLFRALHTFTSQADPTDVEAQGGRIGEAAGASAGFIGGMAGGLAGGAATGAAGRRLGLDPHAPPRVPDADAPHSATGAGPTITADPPPRESAAAPVADRPAIVPPEPVAPRPTADRGAPMPALEAPAGGTRAPAPQAAPGAGPRDVDPHPSTIPAPEGIDPRAATRPAPEVVDPHGPTIPAAEVVDPHGPTLPAPEVVDPHAPTRPAPQVVDPHAPTVPMPEIIDPHAPTSLPEGGGMPEIPPPPRLPEIGPLPDYGPELPDWTPQPSPYAPTELPPPMPVEPLSPSRAPTEPATPSRAPTKPATPSRAPTEPATPGRDIGQAPATAAPSSPMPVRAPEQLALPGMAIAPSPVDHMAATPVASNLGVTGGRLTSLTEPLSLHGFGAADPVPQGLQPGAIGSYGRAVATPHPFALQSNPAGAPGATAGGGRMPQSGRQQAGVYYEHQTPAAVAHEVLPGHQYDSPSGRRRGGRDVTEALTISFPESAKPIKDPLDAALLREVRSRQAAGEPVSPVEVIVRGAEHSQQALAQSGAAVPPQQVSKTFLGEMDQFHSPRHGYQEVPIGQPLPPGHPLLDVPASEIGRHLDTLFGPHTAPPGTQLALPGMEGTAPRPPAPVPQQLALALSEPAPPRQLALPFGGAPPRPASAALSGRMANAAEPVAAPQAVGSTALPAHKAGAPARAPPVAPAGLPAQRPQVAVQPRRGALPSPGMLGAAAAIGQEGQQRADRAAPAGASGAGSRRIASRLDEAPRAAATRHSAGFARATRAATFGSPQMQFAGAARHAWFGSGTREQRVGIGGLVGSVAGGALGGPVGAQVGAAVGAGVARRAEDFDAGLERGAEPIVEPVNPAYPAPPGGGTRQEIVEMQNRLLDILAARARAEALERAMAADAAHHEANRAPLTDLDARTGEALGAARAHQQATAQRETANRQQQAEETNVGATLSEYGNRAAGLVAITGPLQAFTQFTSLAHILPDSPEVLVGAKRGILQMNHDGQQFLDALSGVDDAVAEQRAATPARGSAIGVAAGRIVATAAGNASAQGQLGQAQAGGQALAARNDARAADSRQRQGQAAQTGAHLDAQAGETQAGITGLAAQWQAWAQAHRQARADAMAQTRTAMLERGWRPREEDAGVRP